MKYCKRGHPQIPQNLSLHKERKRKSYYVCRLCKNLYQTEYRKTHPEYVRRYRVKDKNVQKAKGYPTARRWRNLHPWLSHYNIARHRCLHGRYVKYNRIFNMTLKDFEYLWFRDKAASMDKPSIDRINNDKGYFLNNCRFIELSENIDRYWREKKAKVV